MNCVFIMGCDAVKHQLLYYIWSFLRLRKLTFGKDLFCQYERKMIFSEYRNMRSRAEPEYDENSDVPLIFRYNIIQDIVREYNKCQRTRVSLC